MSYSRMEIIDNETIIDKKLIDNLQDGLDDLYGNRQVASYSSIKQVGLDVGAETLVDIVTVLPDASQLLTAVDETHNVQEYPHPNGNLLIECTKKGYGRAKFWVTVEGVPRIWNGVIEDGEWKGWIEDFNSANLTPEKIGASTVEYVDQQILRITETGIPKLMVYPLSSVATEEGQTTFDINLSTFDKNTDTVFVQSGRTMLSPNLDFSVEDNKVVLKEGVQKGRTVEIYVFKNVPLGEEGSVSGIVLAPSSIPLNRLEVMPATPDYVDQQIAKSAETGVPKLMVYPFSQVSTTDNQTVFNITLNTFDSSTDTVLVQSGRTMLFPNEDFTVVDKTIVLNEGVPKDVTIGIYIFKNVPLGEDGSVSGVVISPKSLPLNRLAEEVVTKSDFTELGNKVNYIELSTGFDLNNALGKYRTSQSSIVQTLLNMPSSLSGATGEIIIDWYPSVSTNEYGVQKLIRTRLDEMQIYYRTKNGTTWEEWKQTNSSMDLLWENASPTSAFVEQTINLDLSKYKRVLIVHIYKSDDVCKQIDNVLVGQEFYLTQHFIYTCYRKVYVNSNGLRFELAKAYATYGATHAGGDNTYVIPYQVYGIK